MDGMLELLRHFNQYLVNQELHDGRLIMKSSVKKCNLGVDRI